MTRVSIPVTHVTRAGVAQPSQVAADASNKNQLDTNDGITMVEIVSTDAGPQTVSFEIAQTVDGDAVTSKVESIAAGATIYAGPFPTNIYNQSGGQLFIDPSVSTTLKFRAYSISG